VNILRLPQADFINVPDAEILLIAGGRRPDSDYFKILAHGKKIFCIDKGIEICRDCNILPEILIGDFDSAEKSAIDWAIANNIPTKNYPVEKDFTDTQIALELLGKNVPAIVTGIFGKRFDHLYSNIFSCANYEKIFLADESEIIFYVKGGESIEINFAKIPTAISLLPITETCEGVTTENLHWELSNATLKQNLPNAISNRAENSKIKVSVKRGILAGYFTF
jgi:thiamine pyrophosphokinase